MYINLSGLNILVTGASRGLGRAISTKLAEAGATIAIHYNKNMNDAESLAQILGNESKAFQADLADSREAVKLLERVLIEMGSIEVLINNAGIAEPASIDMSQEEWDVLWQKTLGVNLHSPAILCKKAIQHFIQKKASGRIIKISSRAAYIGETAEYLAYASSKAGLVALTRSIAKSFGKKGIKAFNVCLLYTSDAADE